jgi:hypothetical protein
MECSGKYVKTEQVGSCPRISFLPHIEEVPVCNLGADIIFITKAFHRFLLALPYKCWDSSLRLTRSRPLSSICFTVEVYSCVDYITCIRTYVTAHFSWLYPKYARSSS